MQLVVTAAPQFPQGNVVGAYPQRLWAGPAPQPGDTPGTQAVTTATVDEHGFVELAGLAAETTYYIGSLVRGTWLWKTARTAGEATGGGGGGGGGGEGLSEAAVGVLIAAEATARANGDTTLAASIAALAGAAGITSAEAKAIIAATELLPVKKAPVITTSGSFTPDLSTGNVFKVITTGPLTIHAPINAPSSPADRVILAQVTVIGEFPVTLSGITWSGQPIAQDTSSSSAENVFPLEALDSTAPWKAIGTALPEGVPVIVGSPGNGQGLIWNATLKHWEPGNVGGLTKAEVDAEIAAKAIVIDHPLHVEGTVSEAGEHIVTTSLTTAAPKDFVNDVLATATGRLDVAAKIETTTPPALEVDNLYRVLAAAAKLTMPEGELITHGRLVAIENASGAAIKLTGKFTPSEPLVVTTIELKGAETVLYVAQSEGAGVVWVPLLVGRTLAALEALITAQALTALPSTVASGLSAASFDLPSTTATPTLGSIHISKIMVPRTITAKELLLEVVTAGSGPLTSAFGGVFNSSGEPLGGGPKENEHAQLEAVGPAKLRLTSTATIVGGPAVFVYGALLVVGGVAPVLGAASFPGRLRDINGGLGSIETIRAGEGRNSLNEASYTAMPAALALSNSVGKSADRPFFWMGLK